MVLVLASRLPIGQFSAIGWVPTVMRKVVVFGTWLACLASVSWTNWAQSAKQNKPETLLRWQFAGTKQVANVNDLKSFREVFSLPETSALRTAAAQHFAALAARRFTQGGDTNAN